MNLISLRKKTGLGRGEFVRRLTPFIKGFSLDEFMLTRMEGGDSFQEERMQAIYLAAVKAFPEHSIDEPKLKEKKNWPKMKISGMLVGSIFFGIFLIGMAVIYLLFPDSAQSQSLDRFLAAIGTSVTVIGFFIGLYIQSKK
jgi:hypothetical protein